MGVGLVPNLIPFIKTYTNSFMDAVVAQSTVTYPVSYLVALVPAASDWSGNTNAPSITGYSSNFYFGNGVKET